MKSSISLSHSLLIVALLLFACRGPEAKENEKNSSASIVSSMPLGGEKYSMDKKESVLTWKGSMVIANVEEHIGYVYISKGELIIEKTRLVGGMVEINMNSIEYKDKELKTAPLNT